MSMPKKTSLVYSVWALSVLFLLLSACGTEIGNGWKADDGTSNKDPKTSPSADQSNEDTIVTGDVGAGDDGSEDGLMPESDAKIGGLPDNEYETDLLFAECGSPFGDAIATEDYHILGATDTGGHFAYWSESRWTYTNDEQGETVYRYVLPQAGEPAMVTTANDGTATPSGITCSNRTEDDAATVDGDSWFRSVTLTLTLASGKARQLTWFVNKNSHRLVRVEIESADLESAVLNFLDPDE